MITNLLFLAAFQFRLHRFLEPTFILASRATPAEPLRWAAVLNLGYYLVTAVLAYVLWRPLRPRNPSSLFVDHGRRGLARGRVGWAAWPMVAPTPDARLHRCRGCRSGADYDLCDHLQVVWRAIWQFLTPSLGGRWLESDGSRLGHLRRSACRWCSPCGGAVPSDSK
jgi:hypothetical protein